MMSLLEDPRRSHEPGKFYHRELFRSWVAGNTSLNVISASRELPRKLKLLIIAGLRSYAHWTGTVEPLSLAEVETASSVQITGDMPIFDGSSVEDGINW